MQSVNQKGKCFYCLRDISVVPGSVFARKSSYRARVEVIAMSNFDRTQFMSALAVSTLAVTGCGCGGSLAQGSPSGSPVITTTPALNGAVVVTLSSSTPRATIYYTVDGSAPTASSPIFEAPFLVASNLTVNAIATAPGDSSSSVATMSFAPNISSGTLVWSDEFSNSTGVNAQPNPAVWTYDTGTDVSDNGGLEDYCAWNSSISPCTTSAPSLYVGTDGYLHIVAAQPSPGVYTSTKALSILSVSSERDCKQASEV